MFCTLCVHALQSLRCCCSQWTLHCAGDLKGANVLLKSSGDDPRGYTCKVSQGSLLGPNNIQGCVFLLGSFKLL